MGTPAPGRIRRALLSVSNATGLPELARFLQARDVQLVASGGTMQKLQNAGIEVTPVEQVTGFPELLGGRVKTLHPRIHAGLLADRRNPEHLLELEKHGILLLDLLVGNLYPFASLRQQGADRDQLREAIDVGGTAMLRAAAKNCLGGVTVLSSPEDYSAFQEALESLGEIPWELREKLAARTFERLAVSEVELARYWSENAPELPGWVPGPPLRHGENPHQSGTLLLEPAPPGGIARAQCLQGKALSYNNYLDLDAAARIAHAFSGNACAVIKHGSPCGLAVAEDQVRAFEEALSGDPGAAFGGVLGFNQPLTTEASHAILKSKLFVECIVAPGFSSGSRETLSRRKNLRLVELPPGDPSPSWHGHRIGGGMLIQEVDPGPARFADWTIPTKLTPDPAWETELLFADRAVACLHSNAITITRGTVLVGAGGGQASRVDACTQALQRAGDRARGGVLASDAFFPFDDCVRLAAAAGIRAVVQPGGSRRDQLVIDACDETGLIMMFTGRRHFRH